MPNMPNLAARVREITALHLDPDFGAPYWIGRSRALNLRVAQIQRVDDLALLGPMDAQALAQLSVEDFIPRKFIHRRGECVIAETGGTLGRAKFAVHRDDEFEAAFVRPFVTAATKAGFPLGVNWLFVGPSGPHIIGKAARACARAMGAPDPFTTDFDPRWAKKLPDGSLARTRYVQHIAAQALNILETQSIGAIFATPPVIESLAEKIAPAKRDAVRGIHFGGMPVTSALRQRLHELFSHAVLISGYGNTLFGVAPELHYSDATGIDYFTQGTRLLYRVVPLAIADESKRISETVGYLERGQICAHRLDEMQFIANMLERDTAVRIPPLKNFSADGFILDGLRDPQPLIDATTRPALGLY